jgi:hypothetical protein
MTEKSQYTESNTEFKRNGNSIYNGEFLSYLIDNDIINSSLKKGVRCEQDYVEEYTRWIDSSELNSITGLDSFNYRFPSIGVTQSLDEFHYFILENGLRLRMFRGEYPYNRDVHVWSYDDFIDDKPLAKGDAIIISCPFSGTGSIHSQMSKTLDEAYDLKVPVFVDMAWFGTCKGIDIDLSHPAIQEVAFSTTKGLCTGDYRSGIRFSRHGGIEYESIKRKDRLALQADWSHSCHLNNRISLELMKNFSPDYQWTKYSKAQGKVCATYGLTPSNCLHIALGDRQWDQFHRDQLYNRINIGKVVKRVHDQKE